MRITLEGAYANVFELRDAILSNEKGYLRRMLEDDPSQLITASLKSCDTVEIGGLVEDCIWALAMAEALRLWDEEPHLYRASEAELKERAE